jgi:phytoene dehydrogenase-like protein
MDDTTVVVAGAGLAGLVAARRLATEGADVTVFERRDEVGGRVRTLRRDGRTLDRGFQVLFTAYPAVREELDLGALDLRTFSSGAVVARPGERSTLADPLQNPEKLLATLRTDEVTTTDKLRTLALRQHLSTRTEDDLLSGPDASIRAYLRDWGFSEKYVENFVAPFYGGITLDRSLSTSKRVFEYTFKMLSEGRTVVPAEGMGAIPAQLAAKARDVGATFHTDRPVEGVQADDDGATVYTADEAVEADAVVVATDPRSARDLTGVPSIPTDARACVTQYYSLPEALPVGRTIVLNAEGAAPNSVAPLSTVAPAYAPAGTELLSATFLGDGPLEESAGSLERRTREALSSWFPARSFDALERVHTSRIEFAQFDQPPGVHDDLPETRAPAGRAYLAGDYTSWSSIQGAMRSGQDAAAAVRDDLAD